MDGFKSADEASDKSDSVSSDGGQRKKHTMDFWGDDKIADLTGGELIVGNNLDNVGDLTVDGSMGDGGDQSVIDNMDDFAGCNTYVGGNDLNDEKPSDQMCNKCVSWMKTSTLGIFARENAHSPFIVTCCITLKCSACDNGSQQQTA